jgi:hypothetical protein
VLVTRSYFPHIDNSIHNIRYWDAITQKIIDTTTFEAQTRIVYEFTFSPDGKEIVIACDDGVRIERVPFFKIMYEANTKEKCSYILGVLKQYAIQHDLSQIIPAEIIKLLVSTYLATCKRKV